MDSPVLAAPMEYASDPESTTGTDRRASGLGISGGTPEVGLSSRVRGFSRSGAAAHADGAAVDDAVLEQHAVPVGAVLLDAMGGQQDDRARGAGEAKKQSAGRRLGKMLRRSTPSLTHLRSYSTSKMNFRGAGKNALSNRNPSAMEDDLAIQLGDPPSGNDSNDNGCDDSALPTLSRVVSESESGTAENGFINNNGNHNNDHRNNNHNGNGVRGRSGSAPAASRNSGGCRNGMLFRTIRSRSVEQSSDDVSFWSGPEGSSSGTGAPQQQQQQQQRRRRKFLAIARRDSSAPPCGRAGSTGAAVEASSSDGYEIVMAGGGWARGRRRRAGGVAPRDASRGDASDGGVAVVESGVSSIRRTGAWDGEGLSFDVQVLRGGGGGRGRVRGARGRERGGRPELGSSSSQSRLMRSSAIGVDPAIGAAAETALAAARRGWTVGSSAVAASNIANRRRLAGEIEASLGRVGGSGSIGRGSLGRAAAAVPIGDGEDVVVPRAASSSVRSKIGVGFPAKGEDAVVPGVDERIARAEASLFATETAALVGPVSDGGSDDGDGAGVNAPSTATVTSRATEDSAAAPVVSSNAASGGRGGAALAETSLPSRQTRSATDEDASDVAVAVVARDDTAARVVFGGAGVNGETSVGSASVSSPNNLASTSDNLAALLSPALNLNNKNPATTKRRRLAELLHFRRRSTMSTIPPSSSGIAGGIGGSSSAAEQQQTTNGDPAATSDAAGAATRSRGRRAARRIAGASSCSRRPGSAPPGLSPENNNKSCSRGSGTVDLTPLDPLSLPDPFSAAGAAGAAASSSSSACAAAAAAVAAGARRGRAARRRRARGGGRDLSSSCSGPAVAVAGGSASPAAAGTKQRESFIEAGRHKLRRGRSRLTGGGGGGVAASFPGRRRASSASASAMKESDGGGYGEETGGQEEEEEEEEDEDEDEDEEEQEEEEPEEPEEEEEEEERCLTPVPTAAAAVNCAAPATPPKAGPPARPQLGTTYTQRPRSAPLESDLEAPWNTWAAGCASVFRVRTKGYGKTRVKAPSAPELYELVSVDAYRSPAGRISEVYPMFSPPACFADGGVGSPNGVGVSGVTKNARFPCNGNSIGEGETASGCFAEEEKESPPGVHAASRSSRMAASPLRNGRGVSARSGDIRDGEGKPIPAGGGDGSRTTSSVKGTGHPDIPPVLVVNCQLPDVPTPFSAQGDGPTIQAVFTFRATDLLCRYAARTWAAERGHDGAAREKDDRREDNRTDRTDSAAIGDAAAATMARAVGSGLASPCSPVTTNGRQRAGRRGVGDAVLGDGAGKKGRSEFWDGDGNGDRCGDCYEDEEEAVPESVALLAEWVRRAGSDGEFRGRFKAIGDVVNADEVGLPGIARRFSGKPVLVYGKECSVVRGDGFVELDLNAHAFSYVGRKGLYITLDKWKTAIFRIGFLIEGRTDDEQPEHMLGCGVLKGLDMSMLTELSRSPDGERLIVGNPYDNEYREPHDDEATKVNVDSIASLLGSSGAESSSRPVISAGRKERGADLSQYSDVVPLVPFRHVECLRGRRGGAHNGNPELAFVDDGDDEEDQGATTVAAVAAAAFAGGWFSALLAVATMACWTELSGNGGGEEEGWGRVGGAWLVRMLTYGR